MRTLLGTITLVLFATTANAAEPAFCDPKTFAQYETQVNDEGMQRLHVYQIGKLKLAGLAVGKSDSVAIENLAAEIAEVPKSERSCTWYLNKGNKDAEAAFNHRYVPAPYFWANKSTLLREYSRVMNTAFDRDQINMVECATKYNYVAMGCNGHKHRGPTVFAMFLAYAGCSPKNATKIVKSIWGSNHVPSGFREHIAQLAYDWGTERPEGRKKLQELMTAK